MINLLHAAFHIPNITILFWQDMIEISGCIYFFYRLPLWLLQHERKNRIGYFYLYALALLITHIMHLSLFFWILLIIAPIFCMALIICPVHQTTVQNVKAASFNSSRTVHTSYTEIMQCALLMMHTGKKSKWVIAHPLSSDQLTDITGNLFNAELSFDTLRLLTTHPTYLDDHALLIDTRGIIVKYNIPLTSITALPQALYITPYDETQFTLRTDHEQIVCNAHDAVQFLKKYFTHTSAQGKNNAPSYHRYFLREHSL